MLEIYGLLGCPFSWRVRFAAHEKGVPYQWIPVNVPHPDPRVALNNPERRSPLSVHEGLALADSLVIAQYIDEAFEGRPLQPGTAQERARGRMLMASFAALGAIVHGERSEDAMTRLLAGYADADRALAAAPQSFLLGQEEVGLADIALLPLLSALESAGQKIPHRFAALEAYWARSQRHEGLRRTAPAAAKMELGA